MMVKFNENNMKKWFLAHGDAFETTSPLKVVCWLVLTFMPLDIWAQASADQLFTRLRDSIYQIRIIELKSGSQSALGTGFLVAPNLLATNYHVVSSSVLEPEKYRIEITTDDKKTRPLSVATVDVVHDLAVLEIDQSLSKLPFDLSTIPPKNGEKLYSLGNPHNLGLTIVEGNYNGMVENKFIEQIHFSGAINSGMSGGPTVNANAEVVGINVATGGNQLGFLVPVDYLARLIGVALDLPENYDLLSDMADQISASTDAMLEFVLSSEWPEENIGSAVVVRNTVDWLTCWGNSKDDKEKGILNISRGCNNGDNIFINSRFTSGFFEYEYAFFEAENWPSAAFYRYLRSATGRARAGNRASEDDVENYRCVDKLVEPQQDKISIASGEPTMSRRVSYCTRAYKKLPGLYDVFYIGVSQDHDNKAVLEHFTVAGVTKSSSLRFLKRFMGVLRWGS